MHNFKRFSVFTLASASAMLEASKEKADLWAAEFLVVGFSREVEAQSRDFAVALDEELAHAKRDEVFVTWGFESRIRSRSTPSQGGTGLSLC